MKPIRTKEKRTKGKRGRDATRSNDVESGRRGNSRGSDGCMQSQNSRARTANDDRSPAADGADDGDGMFEERSRRKDVRADGVSSWRFRRDGDVSVDGSGAIESSGVRRPKGRGVR